MDLLLIGTAFLFTFLAVIVWQLVRSGPLTGTELRRRINALHHDNIGHQPAGRYVPPSHDLEPVQVPATVVSGSLTTVDPTAAEPDPARLARGAAVLDRGTAVLEQGVGTRPSKPADLATAPGRNCALFAALCKLALGGSDEGLLTWARTLNREFSVPLVDAEVRGVWRSVCRYRARWRVQGHQQAWLFRQAARGRKGGSASGEARRAGTPLEHDRAPWAALGVSRRTWYRHFRGVKTDGESRWAKVGTEANTDRSGSGHLFLKA